MEKGRARETGILAAVFGLLMAAVFFAANAEGLNLESAKEFKFEVGGGLSKYHAREDGVWWQSNSQLKTSNDLKSFGYQIGMRWPNVRLAFVNLGRFHGDNEWVGDGATQHYPFQCPVVPDDCRFNGKISGNAYGLSLGPVIGKNFDFLGVTFRAEAEGGGFLFRSNQTTNICPIDGQPTECFTYNRMWGMHRTWYVGAGVGRGAWSLNYRLYKNIYEQGDDHGKGGDVGMTGGATQTIFATYAFD